ncbi:MAG: M3 family oligoendopeptidase [Spirochaetales bacterium]|nr:M3 family oligoendopeptidase [Spirochaetales bacterium]
MKSLPVWELKDIYSSLEDRLYKADCVQCRSAADAVSALVNNIPRTDAEKQGWLNEFIRLYNQFHDLFETLYAYVYMRFSVNTEDYAAVNQMNMLEEIRSPVKTSVIEFRQVVTSLECSVAECMTKIPELSRHSFFINEQIKLKSFQMSKPEEQLAEQLSRTGGDMWGRLQETASSSLSIQWPGKGAFTVTRLRSFSSDPDRAVRKKAYNLELQAWKSAETTFAFALNGVKGFSTVLNKKRNYKDTKHRSIMQSRISEGTLNALISSMTESLPDFRNYLTAKARFLGIKKCAFFDLFAPLPGKTKLWSFPATKKFIVEQFGGFSNALGRFVEKAFDDNWIDAEPRKGKVGGAYCISLPKNKGSRILCNFNNTFSAVTTVAHELGHAYHHHVLRDETAILRDYPMTLAETASIFSENIVFDGALETFSKTEKVQALEHFLQDATQVIVDILSRFLFETAIMNERETRELSPDEFCTHMLEAQKKTYGDALDPEFLHPHMWAVKGHYYRADLAFYNFPYAFGLLFGLALFSRFKTAGKSFAKEYDRILSLTGKMTCVELTRELGYDIESTGFWKEGLALIAERVKEFQSLSMKQ